MVRFFPLFNNVNGEEIRPPWVRELIVLNQVPVLVQFLAYWRYLNNLLHGDPLSVGDRNDIFASFDVLFRNYVPIRWVLPSWLTLVYCCSFFANILIKLLEILTFNMIFWQHIIQLNILFNFLTQEIELVLICSFFDPFVQNFKCLF